MSRYRGNSDTCPCCGLTYRDFRTGLTYADVFLWLWSYSQESSNWKYKRRRTVLGRWHMTKKQMWNQHIFECAIQSKSVRAARALNIPLDQYVPGVPF